MAFTFTETGNTRVTARPSGTEPKIKFYVSATSADIARPPNEDLVDTKAAIDELAEEIAEGILEAADATLETQQS
jgi:phosphomannomutase